MADELAFENGWFPTLKGSWPWPWIGSYCIPSCITHRPLHTCQISLKSKKLFVDGRMYACTDGHLRPALLGRLWTVDIKIQRTFQRPSRILNRVFQEANLSARNAKIYNKTHCRKSLRTITRHATRHQFWFMWTSFFTNLNNYSSSHEQWMKLMKLMLRNYY